MIDRDIFKLSIVIPCYNEKNTIENILKKIDQSLKDYKISKYEIIIVDDFSNDGTRKLLKNFAFDEKIQIYYHDFNLGLKTHFFWRPRLWIDRCVSPPPS